MKCKSCRRVIEPDSLFCRHCGARQFKIAADREFKVPAPHYNKSKKEYAGQIMINGERITVKGETEAAYKAKVMSLKAELIKEESSKSFPTLRCVMTDYLAKHRETISPASARNIRMAIQNRFQAYMDLPINEIDYQQMINDEAKTGKAPGTIRNAWLMVSPALKSVGFAKPAVVLPKMPKPEKAWLNYEQIRVFLKAIEGTPHEPEALLMLHSLRISEVLALRAGSVKDEYFSVRGAAVRNELAGTIYRETNKTKSSSRDVPYLLPRLKELLQAAAAGKEPNELIFSNGPQVIRECINRVCRKAGLPEVGCHGLRRSFASLAYHLKWDPETVKIIGGWEEINTVLHYYKRLSVLEINEDVERMKTFFTPPEE